MNIPISNNNPSNIIKQKRLSSPFTNIINFPPKPRNDIKNHKLNNPSHNKIIEIYNTEFDDELPFILIKNKEDFLKEIRSTSEIILQEIYSNKEISDEDFQSILKGVEKDINEKYQKNLKILSNAWSDYQKNPKKFAFLKHYRKHCIYTDEYAFHSCEYSNSKLIEIPNEKNIDIITHLICINCKKCYFSHKILLYCNYCKNDYFSCILPKEENSNILPATWAKYHCSNLINDTMKCLKCKNTLYLDLKANYLICINQNCGFKAKPHSIIWNCANCKKEFKSDAKIFNPMEMQVIKRSIKLALLFKKKIYPNELPCCKINPKDLIFYHKEGCNGELYKGILNKKDIIVCSKCKAMNFFDKFFWTCPLCKKRFKSLNNTWEKIFNKKEYLIEGKYSSLRRMTGEKRISFNAEFLSNNIENINSNKGIRSSSGGVNFFSYNRNYSNDQNYSLVRNASGVNNNNLSNLKNCSNDKIINLVPSINQNKSFNNIPKNKNKIKNNHSNSKGKKQYQTLIEILEERDGKPRLTSSNSKVHNHKKSNSQSNFSKEKLNYRKINIPNYHSSVGISNKEMKNFELNDTNNNSISKNNEQKMDSPINEMKKITINRRDEFLKSKSRDERGEIYNLNRIIKPLNLINKGQNLSYFKKKEKDNDKEEEEKEEKKDNFEDKKILLKTLEPNKNKNQKQNLYEIQSIRESTFNDFSFTNSTLISQNNEIFTSPQQIKLIIKEGRIPTFNIEKFIFKNPIGEGSFGKIYLIEKELTHEQFALKKIICNSLKEVKQFQKVFELVYSKKHKNIMKIYNIEYKCLDSTTYSIYVLMELALSDWNKEIKKRAQKKNYYLEIEIIKILNQILNALLFLENEGIAHRDIKPQNILIYPNDIFKVADFGEAKNLKAKSQECTLRGSELYMSPILYNCLKNRKKDVLHNAYKSDVFSFGLCLLYSMTLSIQVLNDIREVNSMIIINQIVKRAIRRNYSNKMQNLVLGMLEIEEKKRFSFKEIKNYIQQNFNLE